LPAPDFRYTIEFVIFAWDDENCEHIGMHAVIPAEAEDVVGHSQPPFPQNVGEGRFRVWGRTAKGRLLQVIYVLKSQATVSYDSVDALDWAALEEHPGAKIVRIIHAMELTADMKRQFRRLHR
jgi:uncharacterized DUF497 family protein